MNYRKKTYLQWKSIWVRAVLALVLLLTSSSIALADPNTPDTTDSTTGTGVPHHQHGRKELINAPVKPGYQPGVKASSANDSAAQPQHAVQPKTADQPAETPDVSHLDNHLYLPLIQQGDGAQSDAAEVQAAAVTLPVDLKLLVISADGKETDYPALTAFLSQIGIPFDTLIATQTPLTASKLSDGVGHGYYQGIMLVTGNLIYLNPATNNWESAFTQEQWNTLWQYEAQYGVRQVTSYTYPGGWPESYGLNYVTYQDTTNAPLNATLTAAGQKVYPYLKATTPITFKNA